MITLRNDMLNFTRETQAKLALLREVVQRVKDGEEVDVMKALGTGDPKAEAEWEEVVRELETTDMLLEGRKKRDAKRKDQEEQKRMRDEERKEVRGREGPIQEIQQEADGSATERRPRFVM